MISQLAHLLSPAEPGSIQARQNPQSGVRDFGALLEAHETEENARKDSDATGEREASSRQQSNALRQRTAANASGLASAVAPAPVVKSVDAGTPGGTAELVSIPWRLQANAGLSYLAMTTVVDEGADPCAAHTDEKSVSREPDDFALPGGQHTFAVAAENDPTTDWMQSMRLLSGAAGSEEPAAPMSAMHAVGAATAGTAPVSPIWPERMLRWLPDADGKGSTAWIRDYRLDPSAADGIVQSLQSLARQQGIRLNRVVLNGHPIWHSASTSKIPPRD